MGRTLPPAKRGQPHSINERLGRGVAVPVAERLAQTGGGRLQHSSKAPVVVPTARDQTPEERAASAAGVQEAYTRAGLETPEKRAAYHAAIQTHVPRMIDWYDRQIAEGRLQGHGDVSGGENVPQATARKIYQRPAPEAHG